MAKKKTAKHRLVLGMDFDFWAWYRHEWGYGNRTFYTKKQCERHYGHPMDRPGMAVRVKFVEVKP